MTLTTIAAMFSAMVALAIIPDASAMAVAARSISSGFKHGVVVIVGIIVGDLIFILLAIFGLSTLAETRDGFFDVIKYFGATYLVFIGLLLWREKPKEIELEGIKESSWRSNFICGLLITLGDPKAILFYLSFLPAFVDLSVISFTDIGLILITVIAALCCTKLVYAFMADKSRALFKSSRAKRTINIVAGSVMIATAIYIIVQV
jgi:threonine/homoserine/homoserine lactone efflux protein